MVAGVFIYFIALAVSLVSLVLNAYSISFWNKGKEEFKKAKKIVITAIVFNFIFILIELIMVVIMPRYVGQVVVSAVAVLLVLAANILAIISLAKENDEVEKKVEKLEAKSENMLTFEKKMKKLAQMRESDQITEEEYDLLKKSFIADEINDTKNK